MRDKNRVNKVVLLKMIDYCNDIEEILKANHFSFESYLVDKFFRYACDMCTFQIGELTTRLSEDFKEKNFEIEWHKIKGLRNIFAHEYEQIDYEQLWKTLTNNIPDLKRKLEKILAEEFN